MNRIIGLAIGLVCIGVVGSGCEMFRTSEREEPSGIGATAFANINPSRAATTQPSLNNVNGRLAFKQTGEKTIHVTGDIRGLTPNAEHGFHIHEKGDLASADLSSAGPHFNPTGMKHGGTTGEHRHLGDLGNIRASSMGVALVDITIEGATLEGPNAIAGRSIVVHAKPDDLKTDPSGDSGARIAAGVIEMQK